MDKETKPVETQEENATFTDDSLALQEAIVRLFNSHFAEVLDILSSRFPHVRGDNSMNELEFRGLRAKVLRSGNNKIRILPEILQDFSVHQIMETEIEVKAVETPVVVR